MKKISEMKNPKTTIYEPTEESKIKIKRFLSPFLWQKIKSKLPDQFFQPFCSTEEMERTRVYHVWPGNNVSSSDIYIFITVIGKLN